MPPLASLFCFLVRNTTRSAHLRAAQHLDLAMFLTMLLLMLLSLSLQGVQTDDRVAAALAAAEAEGVTVAWHLEPYPGRSAASVRRANTKHPFLLFEAAVSCFVPTSICLMLYNTAIFSFTFLNRARARVCEMEQWCKPYPYCPLQAATAC